MSQQKKRYIHWKSNINSVSGPRGQFLKRITGGNDGLWLGVSRASEKEDFYGWLWGMDRLLRGSCCLRGGNSLGKMSQKMLRCLKEQWRKLQIAQGWRGRVCCEGRQASDFEGPRWLSSSFLCDGQSCTLGDWGNDVIRNVFQNMYLASLCDLVQIRKKLGRPNPYLWPRKSNQALDL